EHRSCWIGRDAKVRRRLRRHFWQEEIEERQATAARCEQGKEEDGQEKVGRDYSLRASPRCVSPAGRGKLSITAPRPAGTSALRRNCPGSASVRGSARSAVSTAICRICGSVSPCRRDQAMRPTDGAAIVSPLVWLSSKFSKPPYQLDSALHATSDFINSSPG